MATMAHPGMMMQQQQAMMMMQQQQMPPLEKMYRDLPLIDVSVKVENFKVKVPRRFLKFFDKNVTELQRYITYTELKKYIAKDESFLEDLQDRMVLKQVRRVKRKYGAAYYNLMHVQKMNEDLQNLGQQVYEDEERRRKRLKSYSYRGSSLAGDAKEQDQEESKAEEKETDASSPDGKNSMPPPPPVAFPGFPTPPGFPGPWQSPGGAGRPFFPPAGMATPQAQQLMMNGSPWAANNNRYNPQPENTHPADLKKYEEEQQKAKDDDGAIDIDRENPQVRPPFPIPPVPPMMSPPFPVGAHPWQGMPPPLWAWNNNNMNNVAAGGRMLPPGAVPNVPPPANPYPKPFDLMKKKPSQPGQQMPPPPPFRPNMQPNMHPNHPGNPNMQPFNPMHPNMQPNNPANPNMQPNNPANPNMQEANGNNGNQPKDAVAAVGDNANGNNAADATEKGSKPNDNTGDVDDDESVANASIANSIAAAAGNRPPSFYPRPFGLMGLRRQMLGPPPVDIREKDDGSESNVNAADFTGDGTRRNADKAMEVDDDDSACSTVSEKNEDKKGNAKTDGAESDSDDESQSMKQFIESITRDETETKNTKDKIQLSESAKEAIRKIIQQDRNPNDTSAQDTQAQTEASETPQKPKRPKPRGLMPLCIPPPDYRPSDDEDDGSDKENDDEDDDGSDDEEDTLLIKEKIFVDRFSQNNNQTYAWVQGLLKFKAFYKKHGHFDVPHDDPKYKPLRVWAKNSQLNGRDYKKGKRPGWKDKYETLDKMGFYWGSSIDEPRTSAYSNKLSWDDYFEMMLEYKEKHGHPNVPSTYKLNPDLAGWTSSMRQIGVMRIRKGQNSEILTLERFNKMDAIGFQWEKLKTIWEGHYEKLKRWKEIHGHCNVPKVYKEDLKLGSWVHNQRQAGRKYLRGLPSRKGMTEKRLKLLQDIGFDFRLD